MNLSVFVLCFLRGKKSPFDLPSLPNTAFPLQDISRLLAILFLFILMQGLIWLLQPFSHYSPVHSTLPSCPFEDYIQHPYVHHNPSRRQTAQRYSACQIVPNTGFSTEAFFLFNQHLMSQRSFLCCNSVCFYRTSFAAHLPGTTLLL